VELSGRTALLTGATGGLGRAIAQALAERGATLVLSSRQAEQLERMARELPRSQRGSEHRYVPADLAAEGAAEGLVAEAGQVDVLVANAGLPAFGSLDAFSEEEIGSALRVNLESPIRMARELAPGMVERGEGHLVFISSLAGKAASARASLYSAAKFGLRGFAMCLRADLAGTGVGASVVSPGFIREAGMFHAAGGRGGLLGTSSPQQVGAAVVRAIERDKQEIAVGPRRQRVLAHFALAAPRLAMRAQSGRRR
jgi:short-subunit dehydrogenase